MSAAFARSEVLGGFSMPEYSQIANVRSIANCRKTGNDLIYHFSQYADMDQIDEKNGGPNHLRAWMRYRKVKGAELADILGGSVTPGMVSDLANSKRALSAKWLRRLAPALNTTPGALLDYDPFTIPADLIEIWLTATDDRRRQLVDVAKAMVRDDAPRDGTHG